METATGNVSVTTDSSTAINGQNYYIGDWWPTSPYVWPYPYTVTTEWPAHACASGHDYQQAAAPHRDTLYCRKCGETKQLKAARARK